MPPSQQIFDFVKYLIWPALAAIAIFWVFRKPLVEFFKATASRVTKLSISQVLTVELSLPEASSMGLDQVLATEVTEFASGELSGSDAPHGLIKILSEEKPLDYFIIDLGEGQRWLTSRLFIFAVMLQRMRALQCLVFVETREGISGKFVGVASPETVRWSLACRYPWLEEAYIGARHSLSDSIHVQSRHGAINPVVAPSIVYTFFTVQVAQNGPIRQYPPCPLNTSGWVSLQKGPYWEHAEWIDRKRLKSDLGDALYTDVWFEDSPDFSQPKRIKTVLCRKGSFVAIVDRDHVFQKLINRLASLEKIAAKICSLPDEQLTK